MFHPWTSGRKSEPQQPPDPIERRSPLSSAIRALDDHELRVLLIALLQEWRARTELRGGHM